MRYCVHMRSYLGIKCDLWRFYLRFGLLSRRVGRRRVGSHRGPLHPRLKKMLAGRSAIVTGAGRGIGAAVSRLLGQHGASVLVNDLDEAAAHASAAAVTAAGESP